MKEFTINSKPVCPYCSTKQEYKAKDYFTFAGEISFDTKCDDCDQLFNMQRKGNKVFSFSNFHKRTPNEMS